MVCLASPCCRASCLKLASPNQLGGSKNKGLIHLTEHRQCLDANDM